MKNLSWAWGGLACAALASTPVSRAAAADDVAALRAELTALRAEYEGRVAALESRIDQLESAAPPSAEAAAPPIAVAGAGGAAGTSSASAFNPAMSLILTGTYANLSQDPADWHLQGFLPSGGEVGPGERGFGLGESEITLSASVDPYVSGVLTAALAGDGEVGVEEAFFRTSALPSGFTLKGGRFLSGVGYVNEIHSHAWDFVDLPLAYQAFFGGPLRQDGVQLKWLAPTDLFLEFGAEAGNGDAFPGTRDESNGLGTYALFGHVGGDLGDSIGWRAGLSWIDADASDRAYDDVDAAGVPVVNAFTGSSRTWIADATLKWAPGGDARRKAVELKGEWLQREEDGRLAYDAEGAGLVGDYRSRQTGWYVQGTYRFAPRWRTGLRYDSLDSGDTRLGLVNDGTLSAADFPLLQAGSPTRTTLMLDWSPTEFSRLRAQYAWDDARDASTDEQWWLQYIYALGAHGAHKF